ncbi:hypothetical protein EJV47_07280 [Hymenobacter gummosus]|uniref:Uncharacterized protein n=1 Tax=Hymenobacter gummosus TaxID=1776032 RepID=A0A3S0JFS7_9BACT|nr:hypothetical protein [Hymenobacter gummosus]RTQ51594.1 hypothetical protein EJV47_07280 [Hymenobacter gummosus]
MSPPVRALGRWTVVALGAGVLTAGGLLAWPPQTRPQQAPEDAALLEQLYWQADSVYRRPDSVFVVNQRLDTVAVATGIFSYLKYDYPLEMSPPVRRYCQQAVALARRGQPTAARQQFEGLIGYYRDNCQPYEGFSDTNNLLTVGTQDAILCAYAYQQLNRPDAALAVLRPWLAHCETNGTQVHRLYLELCVQRYGRARVRRELAHSPQTLHRTRLHDPNIQPEFARWVVNVFGAEIGVGDINEQPTVAEVTAELPKQDFYQVLR